MRALWAVLALLAGCAGAGCGPSYTHDDQTANEIGTRNEAFVLGLCTTDDAGACTPAAVRAHTRIAFCANQRELSVHATPFDGGPPCPKP